MPHVFGYARPTLDIPCPKTHADLLAAAGAEHVFVEETLARAPRSMVARRKMYEQITANDTLIVPSLDRLGFSFDDVVRALNDLITRDINVRILDSGLETKGPYVDAYQNLISILKAASSAFHSEEAKVRIGRARARGGKPAGVKPTLTKDMWPDIRERLKTTKIGDLAEELGVHRQTLWSFRRRFQDRPEPDDAP